MLLLKAFALDCRTLPPTASHTVRIRGSCRQSIYSLSICSIVPAAQCLHHDSSLGCALYLCSPQGQTISTAAADLIASIKLFDVLLIMAIGSIVCIQAFIRTHTSAGLELLKSLHAMQVITKLHSILKPFLLRRVKSDVENSLPGKKELILYAEMTQQQQDFNEELRQNTLNVGATSCFMDQRTAQLCTLLAGDHGLLSSRLGVCMSRLDVQCQVAWCAWHSLLQTPASLFLHVDAPMLSMSTIEHNTFSRLPAFMRRSVNCKLDKECTVFISNTVHIMIIFIIWSTRLDRVEFEARNAEDPSE